MGAKYFIANNYLWMTGSIILIIILAIILLKNHLDAMAFLKAQMIENKKLVAQVEEFQTEYTDALEHLNSANERKLRSQYFAHTKWKEEQQSTYSKVLDVLAKGHLKELVKIKTVHTDELANIKAIHIRTVEGLKGGYNDAIENQRSVHTKIS